MVQDACLSERIGCANQSASHVISPFRICQRPSDAKMYAYVTRLTTKGGEGAPQVCGRVRFLLSDESNVTGMYILCVLNVRMHVHSSSAAGAE